MVFFLC